MVLASFLALFLSCRLVCDVGRGGRNSLKLQIPRGNSSREGRQGERGLKNGGGKCTRVSRIYTQRKKDDKERKKVRTVKNHKCDYSFAPSYVNLLLLRRNRKIESGYIGLHICEQTLLWQTQKSSFLNSPLPLVHFLHAAFSYLFEVALVLKTCDRRKKHFK